MLFAFCVESSERGVGALLGRVGSLFVHIKTKTKEFSYKPPVKTHYYLFSSFSFDSKAKGNVVISYCIMTSRIFFFFSFMHARTGDNSGEQYHLFVLLNACLFEAFWRLSNITR